MVKIVNLTPHDINIVTENGNINIPTSGIIARCSVNRETVDFINGIPINRTVFGKVENLPEPQENTIYIVSSLVGQAASDRTDVFIPDDVVRDEQGKIIGCKALAKIT